MHEDRGMLLTGLFLETLSEDQLKKIADELCRMVLKTAYSDGHFFNLQIDMRNGNPRATIIDLHPERASQVCFGEQTDSVVHEEPGKTMTPREKMEILASKGCERLMHNLTGSKSIEVFAHVCSKYAIFSEKEKKNIRDKQSKSKEKLPRQ